MRYFQKKPDFVVSQYGRIYECDHPAFSQCTLYLRDGIGLAVIQQRYRKEDKSTYWTDIDPWLTDPIYTNPKFMEYFRQKAFTPDKNGIYPTVTVRQIMWALKMKPLKKEPWETVFDHNPI